MSAVFALGVLAVSYGGGAFQSNVAFIAALKVRWGVQYPLTPLPTFVDRTSHVLLVSAS